MTSLRSSRPKRKRTANIQLSKQELQEYLDDGYTSSDIAKNFNVSPAAIDEKIRKFGVKRRKQQKKVIKGKSRPSSPRGRSPRRSTPRSEVTKSPRQANRPSRASSKSPVKGVRASTKQGGKSSKSGGSSPTRNIEDKEVDDSEKQEDPSLNTVVVQVIKDNPNDDLDQIHSLLKSMGFDFDKAYVEEHMQKTAVEKQTTESTEGEEKRAQPPKEEKRPRGRPKKQDSTGHKEEEEEKEEEEGSSGTKGPPIKKEEGDKEGDDIEGDVVGGDDVGGDVKKESEEKEECPKVGDLTSDSKQTVTAEEGTEKLQEGKDENIKEEADEKPQKATKKRPGRPRKKPKKARVVSEGGDGATHENGSETEPGTDGDKEYKPKKRGRKRKRFSEDGEELFMTKRGRPSLQLSEENLKHCIDSGLPRQKIAEVFGTCMRSISRYLELHKMRKSDKFHNCTDAELDEMVSKICKDHPDWGQIHIQEDFAKKGMFFRRAQIRNSVRRVDPIGIELRKLNNLKRRWNRGSLKKLDSILPADGINMTSTDSFLCQPPRTGLNGLSQEDSVRLLKDIVYSSKRKYVEYPPPFKTEESSEESSKEAGEEQQGDELIKAVEAVQMKTEGEPLEAVEAVQVKTEGEPLEAVEAVQVKTEGAPLEAVEAVQVKTEGEPLEVAVAEPETTSGNDEATDQDSTPTGEPTVSTEGLSVEKDTYWKHRLQSMVMSNKRAGRQAAAERRGPEVKIPKEDLKECVDLGYSSTRIADKFSTSKHNVRRHLDMYKLGKARRFEILTDETIDEIVTSVIREHGVLKGRDVYDKIKESGLQIRKDDIRKSLCRLHPKGLHRGDPSILKKSWDAVQKQESDVAFLMQEHRAIVDGNEEDVIVLDTDELAKLMNHEGGIVLVDEHGNIMGGQGDVEEYHRHQQQQQEQEQQQQAHCTIESGHVEGGMVVLQHQEGVVVTAGVDTEQDGTLLSNQEQHNPSDVAAVGASDVAPYQHPGTVADGQETSKEESLERTQHYHLTQTTNNESSLTIANQEHAPENSVAPVVAAAEETTPQSDAGNDRTSEVGQTPQETPAVESHVVEANGDSQAIPTSEESQISAIILEFNVPQGQESGQGVPHTSQEGHYATTQENTQEVYFVQGEQQSEEVRSLVVVNDSQETEEDAKDSVGKEEHIIMQLTESASVPEEGTQQGVSLTSLNTVRPNQLSAQVLLELDRIAQNLQSHEVPGEPAPAVSTQGQ